MEFIHISPTEIDNPSPIEFITRIGLEDADLADDGHDLSPERLKKGPVHRLRIFRGESTVVTLTSPSESTVTSAVP